MNVLQLNPTLPVCVNSEDGRHVNRLGEAFALWVRSPEHHVLYGVAFDDTGEIWWVPNPEVRMAFCWSSERPPRKKKLLSAREEQEFLRPQDFLKKPVDGTSQK